MRRRNPNLLPLVLLVFAIATPAAILDQSPEMVASEGYDEQGSNSTEHRDLDRSYGTRQADWTGSQSDFDRLDRNDDGYLSSSEWLRR
jgi:hypothetical protein